MNSGRLLLIDPHPASLNFYNVLEKEGYALGRVTTNKEQILLSITKEPPNLILIDEKASPGAFLIIRETPSSQNVPIIFVASLNNITGMSQAMGYGAKDFLVKPFSKEEILIRVNIRLKEGKQEDEFLKALENIVDRFPNDPEIRSTLAKAYEKNLVIEKALENYQKLAQLSCEKGDYGESIRALERIVTLLHTHFPERFHALQQVSELISNLALIISQEEELSISQQFIQLSLSPHGILEPTGLSMDQFLKIKRGESMLPEEASLIESQELRAIESPSSVFESPVLKAEEVSSDMFEPLTTEFQITEFLSAKEIEELKENLKDQGENLPILEALDEKKGNKKEESEIIIKDHSEDNVFLEKLELSGFLPQGLIVEYIAEQERLELEGSRLSLHEVLEKKGLLTEYQFSFINQAEVKEFRCPECKNTFRELSVQKNEPYEKRCKQCNFPLLSDVIKEEEIKEEEKPSPQPILKKGEDLLNSKNTKEAVKLFSQVIEKFPDNPEAYTFRAIAKLTQNQFSDALKDANKAVSLDPNNFQALCQRGKAHYYLQHFDKAIEDLSALIQRRLYLFDAYSTRGKSYYQKKDYERAINDLTETIRLRPKFVKAYLYRGRCYYRMGQYTLALRDFNKALEINPNFPNTGEVKKMLEATKLCLKSKGTKKAHKSSKRKKHI